MNAVDFIGSKINYNLFKRVHEVDTICAFTGEIINEGVEVKDVLAANFTDNEYVKYDSKYVSVNVAKCIAEFKVGTKKWMLRSVSYLCTSDELLQLGREEFMPIMLYPPEPPFVLAYSFLNKKHTSFKARINYSKDNYFVITDKHGLISIDLKMLRELYPTLQNWYTRNPEIHSATDTYFNKTDILTGNPSLVKIKQYGIDKFEAENKFINKHRNTSFLELITRLLNAHNQTQNGS